MPHMIAPPKVTLNQIEVIQLQLAKKRLVLGGSQEEALLVLEYLGATFTLVAISESPCDGRARFTVQIGTDDSNHVDIGLEGQVAFIEAVT